MSKLVVVSSFGPKGWEEYAQNFLYSYIQFWPLACNLRLYYHDQEKPPFLQAFNTSYHNLNVCQPLLTEFKEKFKDKNGIAEGSYNYRFDAIKFSNKIYAIMDAYKACLDQGTKYLLWLDADIATKGPLTIEDISFPREGEYLAYLGRKGTYLESSYMMFDLERQEARDFLDDLSDLYNSGELFGYAEWHDGFIIERLINLYTLRGHKAYNLTPEAEGAGFDTFNTSPLGKKMVHFKGPVAKNRSQKVRIQAKSCVPSNDVLNNIKTNYPKFKKWLVKCKRHKGTAIVVSAGPTLQDEIPTIKRLLAKDRTARVFCVKHALPTLMENGIIPFGCIILDPREVTGKSTHDIIRTELFKKISKKTLFFLATMTHPSTVDYLINKGAKVVGWNAASDTAMNWDGWNNDLLVAGGTCSAMRMLRICKVLGFRKFPCFGFDFALKEKPEDYATAKDDMGRPKYLKVGSSPDAIGYYSTGELMAGAQDMEELAKAEDVLSDWDVKFYGKSLGQEVWENVRPKFIEDFTKLEKDFQNV